MYYEDELARVERIYGSVAEYNRCMYEEENYYEPTEEEIAESERRMAAYHAKIKELSGTESEFIRKLVADSEYDVVDIVARVAEHYGVEVDEKWETFYRVPDGKFGISVEYREHCYIKYKFIGNLDLEKFKEIYKIAEIKKEY